MARLWDRPRTEERFWGFVSVPAGVKARPWPLLGPFDQARALGVSFHVANQSQEMAVRLDGQRLISALVNMAVSEGSPKPPSDGRHRAYGLAVIRYVAHALYMNSLPFRLTSKFL